MEFLHDHAGEPGFEELVPMFRPQELLGAHAAAALLATVDEAPPSPVTGAPVELVITTGDNVDNAQCNELARYLTLFAGGRVVTGSGRDDRHDRHDRHDHHDRDAALRDHDGPQNGRNPRFYSPDTDDDRYARRWGFPRAPGLIAAALRPFDVPGLRLPWLTAFGNHDGLLQGRAAFDPGTAAHTVGGRKATALPPGPVADIVTRPLELLTGPSRDIVPDPGRRPFTRAEYAAAHRDVGGAPHGHGFGASHDDDGPAAYVHDTEHVRIITLDTTNPGGYQHGSIGPRQLAWLEDRLREVHGRHLDVDGRWVRTSAQDRLVVICSHHGTTTLTNTVDAAGPDEVDPDLPRLLADALTAVLHRYPNVVAWLSGHVHRHQVRAHPGPTGGFWEIVTASVMEWPSQARSLDLVDNADGTLSIVSTLLDHDAPVRPAGTATVLELAAWHRELAVNDPTSVAGSGAVGTPLDRNVELLVPDPRADAV